MLNSLAKQEEKTAVANGRWFGIEKKYKNGWGKKGG